MNGRPGEKSDRRVSSSRAFSHGEGWLGWEVSVGRVDRPCVWQQALLLLDDVPLEAVRINGSEPAKVAAGSVGRRVRAEA